MTEVNEIARRVAIATIEVDEIVCGAGIGAASVFPHLSLGNKGLAP